MGRNFLLGLIGGVALVAAVMLFRQFAHPEPGVDTAPPDFSNPGREASRSEFVSAYFDSRAPDPRLITDERLRDFAGDPPEVIDRAVLAVLDTRSPLQAVSALGSSGDPLTLPSDPASEVVAEIHRLKAAYDVARSSAEAAAIDVELDSPLQVGVAYPVTLLLQLKDAAGGTAALQTMAAAIPAETAMQDTIQLTGEIGVQLDGGADFTVETGKGGWQLVGADTATVWSWTITPKTTGTRTLMFYLDQRMHTTRSDYTMPVRSYARAVVVEVTAAQMLGNTWRFVTEQFWAFVLGICGLLGGVISFLDLRKRLTPVPAALAPAPAPKRRSRAKR